MQPDRTPSPAETFPREARVRRRSEFQRIQSRGERVHTPHFILMVAARPDDGQRLGVTVTKKIGTAVARNRVKRVLREVFRRRRDLFPRGADVVIIAKKGAPLLGYDAALAEIARVERNLRAAHERADRKRRLDEPAAR